MKKAVDPKEPVVCPFTVLCDNNEGLPYFFRGLSQDEEEGADSEGLPYSFQSITADAKKDYRPLVVPREVVWIESGDYTIKGLESEITVERKSLSDLYKTVIHGREAFKELLARMDAMVTSVVVIEAEMSQILGAPPSQINPKCVYRSILSWMCRFPKVKWLPMPNRATAEVTTFRFLEMYWRQKHEK